jgi:transcriptional regulator with PAS, ATPase and Fis domain
MALRRNRRRTFGRPYDNFSKRFMDIRPYPWPGNIRELQNVVKRSVIVCETENFSVDESCLPGGLLQVSRRARVTSEKLAAQEKR